MDNYDLFEQHEAEMERLLESRPVCSECGEYIQDEYFYEINGEYICEECLNENYRRWTDDV